MSNDHCPKCGYCKACGRSNQPQGFYPWPHQPYYPYWGQWYSGTGGLLSTSSITVDTGSSAGATDVAYGNPLQSNTFN